MEADLLKMFVAVLIGFPLLSLSIRLTIWPIAEMIARLRQSPDSLRMPRRSSARPCDPQLREELAQLRLEVDQLRELASFDRQLLQAQGMD
jgi:hypothetical protein